MSHLEEGLLHALLDGEIPSSELPPIQAHLESCPECRARLAAERELLAESDRLVDLVEVPAPGTSTVPAIVRRRPTRQWPRSLAWAATIVLAAGLGYLARSAGVYQVASKRSASRNDSGAVIATEHRAPVIARERSSSDSVIARERSDRGDLPARQQIASRPAASRNDSGRVIARERSSSASVIARERSDRGDLPARQPIASRPAASRNDSGSVSAAAPAAAAASADEQRRAEASGRNAFSALRAVGKVSLPLEPITFPEAVQRLGGSLRLIDGMVPLRLEAQGAEVRIVYPAAEGELVLAQQLIDGRIVFRLLAPPRFPADSLVRLRARIRE